MPAIRRYQFLIPLEGKREVRRGVSPSKVSPTIAPNTPKNLYGDVSHGDQEVYLSVTYRTGAQPDNVLIPIMLQAACVCMPQNHNAPICGPATWGPRSRSAMLRRLPIKERGNGKKIGKVPSVVHTT